MDPHNHLFSPDAMQVSRLHFYSLGIVAQNKALQSDIIEVTPTEELTMLDGEISSDTVNVTSQGKDATGGTYSTNVKTANSLQAEWLRLGVGNRRTAPDVRRGAEVVIYQFGDSDKFYWTTLKDDSHLRRLETVIWAFSANDVEDSANDATSTYFLEISTHKKIVTFHTSKKNGEFCTYDFQFDTKNGHVILTDDVGNWFMLDSKAVQLHMENNSGSIIDITKEICTITTKDQINMTTKTWNVKCDTANHTITNDNHTIDTGKYHVQDLQMDGQTQTLNYNTQSYSGNTYTGNIATVSYTGTAFDYSGTSFIVTAPIIELG